MEYRYRVKAKSNQKQTSVGSDSSVTLVATVRSSSSTMLSNSKSSSEWQKDKYSISLLLFLYLLQGVPLGMAASIPLIIQTYGVSWSQQATFSFAFWPFSLKLLWAPIIDALFVKRFGRRKTWLVPIQYLIGFGMIILSYFINDLLDTEHKQPHIYLLTMIFFGISFLAASQDVCVDGWALTMLSRENVGWASTCNSVGQTAGYFLGNVVFLALESKDFANRYIRQPFDLELQSTGLITLPSFLFFWGIIFMISTTLVALLKHEIDENYDSNEPHFTLKETYQLLFKLSGLPSVRSIILVLLTVKVGFAATDAMTGLELIERGVAKDSLALLAIPLTPLQIILPFFISKYTTGRQPLNIYVQSYPFRLCLGVVMGIFVYFTPTFQQLDKTFPWYYYALAVFIYGIHQIFVYSMFVSQMAFFARVSDPKIGGTYMTLLNTFANLGSNLFSTSALYLADYLTWKDCSVNGARCETIYEENQCQSSGGVCRAYIDAYYIEVFLCTIGGIVWLKTRYRNLLNLQNLPISAWQIRNRRKSQLSEDGETTIIIA